MTCRRKLKGERELVADIRKRLRMYCQNQSCIDCKYNPMDVNCELAYVTDLLKKHPVQEPEEQE